MVAREIFPPGSPHIYEHALVQVPGQTLPGQTFQSIVPLDMLIELPFEMNTARFRISLRKLSSYKNILFYVKLVIKFILF